MLNGVRISNEVAGWKIYLTKLKKKYFWKRKKKKKSNLKKKTTMAIYDVN